VRLGLTDFDVSAALSSNRPLTQEVARWAYEHDYQGVIYSSRLDAAFDCWALFEGAQYEPLAAASIAIDDEDLVAVAEVFRLQRAR
jgi:hypothetical protein